jgi:hypothetical protein
MEDHRLIDERCLAFDRLITAKLVADPTLICRARTNVSRWLGTCSAAARPALLEWQEDLEKPIEDLISLLLSTDERAVRLRQSSPFAGMLPVAERASILKEFQNRESRAA